MILVGRAEHAGSVVLVTRELRKVGRIQTAWKMCGTPLLVHRVGGLLGGFPSR
jgi:hypothetical protein